MARFECNIPKRLPRHISKAKKAFWEETVQKIYDRYEFLNEALDKSGIALEQFIIVVSPLWEAKTPTGGSVLETFTADQLAEFAKSGAAIPYQPREVFPNADVLVDAAFLTTKEWEAIRMQGIGGSDAAVCVGSSPYRTQRALYWDKTGTDPVKNQVDQQRNFIFAYGHTVEPLVIDTFCKKTGAVVIPDTRMFVKKGYPFITANIDAIVRMPNGDLKIFEAKTTTNWNKDAWKDNAVPPQYIPQVTQYMSVLNDPRITGTYIGCIYGNTLNDFNCKEIERDLAREASQTEIVKDFWETYIEAGELPPQSGNGETDIEDLREYVPLTKVRNVPGMDPDLLQDIERFLELDQERADAEAAARAKKAEVDAVKAHIIDEMGGLDCGGVKIDSDRAYMVTWKSSDKHEFDKKALKKAYPEIYDEFETVVPDASRRFTVKEISADAII